MKDSGIEWIGEIPEDWEVGKIKRMSDIYTGNSIPTEIKDIYADSVDAVPYIATKDISLGSNNIDYENGIFIKNKDVSFKRAPANSTLLCIEGGSAGRKISFTNQEVAFVNKLCCFKSDAEKSKYIYYYLQSPAFKSEFDINISGLIGGVSIGLLKNHSITIPPIREQQKIANFLDQKVFEIDHILEKTRESIEEYKKYKQSIITESVTKGLNPDVEMKHSGIEWIGEIPEHWDITKFKKIIQLKSGDTLTNNLLDNESQYPVYGGGKQIGYFDKYNVTDKNILIGRVGANCGCITLLNNMAWATDNALIVSTNLNKEYVYYLLQSSELNNLNEANAQPLITATKVLNHRIPLTIYKEEQEQIVDYLDKKCTEIDSLISQKEALLKDLEAYKKSLIYECVTGKREVV